METPNAVLDAPGTEGLPVETGSQVQPPTGQPAATVQDVPGVQVETPQPKATSEPDARPQGEKPSDFYRRRNREKQLYDTVASMQKTLQELRDSQKSQQQPTAPGADAIELPKSIVDDPDKAWGQMLSVVASLKQELADLKNGVSSMPEKIRTEERFKSADQEAWELATKSGIPGEEVANYIVAEGLQEDYQRRPIMVAEWVVSKLKQQIRPRNPNVPTKAQMASTATGVPTQATQQATTENLRKTLQEMVIKRANNPQLRNDPAFTAKLDELESQIRKMTGK